MIKEPYPMPLFDYAAGRKLRDEGIEQVTEGHRWIDRAFTESKNLVSKVSEPFALEDIRKALTEAGLEAPHHHNAWGALSMKLSRANLIEKTGVWTGAKSKRSHARMMPLYHWVK